MEYKISGDIRKKEKIVGGLFTLTQTIFLGLAAVVGLGVGILAYNATQNLVFGIICIIIFASPFLPFAFVTIEKMGDMELAKYLWIRFKFRKSQKNFLNINEKYKDYLIENYKYQERLKKGEVKTNAK